MYNYFILLAAGSGKRFKSSIPKQYTFYKQKQLLVHSIDKAIKSRLFKKIILVINKKPDWEAIKILIDEWNPDKFVVGHPFTLHGTRQKMTDAAERFSRQLKHLFKLPVDLIYERLSSCLLYTSQSPRDS